jgi:hypothetical protein
MGADENAQRESEMIAFIAGFFCAAGVPLSSPCASIRSRVNRQPFLSPHLVLATTRELRLTAHISCGEYLQTLRRVMSEAASEAEQKRRDREWGDYQRRTQQRLRQSSKLDFGGKPSDIFDEPLEVEPPTMRESELTEHKRI